MAEPIGARALQEVLARFAGTPVLLVGDLMLDRYLWGEVSRISPEAPVPVLKVEREETRLGGAGCVIANLATFGARVHAVGVVGQDAPGQRVLEMLGALNVETGGVLREASVQTTQKTRLMARIQHLLRVDRDGEQLPQDALARLEQAAIARLDQVRAVLVSDYGRSVLEGELCRRLSAEARRRGIPVLVDPHRNADFARYTGASCLTPNRAETQHAVGIRPVDEASYHAAARALIERYGLDYAAVTLDADGIFLLRRGEEHGQRLPARARRVYDVAGAGDMVLSVLGLAVACGGTLEEAVSLANVAAGLEVERPGVATVTPQEVQQELASIAPPILRRKIVNQEQVAAYVEHARRSGQVVVFTNGCFDLLHAGHVHFLQGCRAKGDYLIVGLNTDGSVRGLKGTGRPVLSLEERATLLAGLEAVDLVVPFDEPTPIALIERVRPDVLCKGEDYKDKLVVGREIVESYGGRVELVELLPGLSTTHVIERIGSLKG